MSNNSSNQNETSQEMSPEAVAVIARAKRSFVFSMSLLVVGLIVVALAIVYRSDGKDESAKINLAAKENYVTGMIVVPSGVQILSAVPSEGMIAVTYIKNGKATLRLIDGTTGAIIRDIDFVKD